MAIFRQLSCVAILKNMENLLFFQFLQQTDKKTRTVKDRKNPFDDFDEEEFKMRFRLGKNTVNKLLEQVTALTN